MIKEFVFKYILIDLINNMMLENTKRNKLILLLFIMQVIFVALGVMFLNRYLINEYETRNMVMKSFIKLFSLDEIICK